jgi:rubrerythrin
VASGAVKWFTRKSAPRPVDADAKRRRIRAALRLRRQIELGDKASPANSRRPGKRPRYRCAGCGYGIVAEGKLPRCPMCRASAWVPSTGG